MQPIWDVCISELLFVSIQSSKPQNCAGTAIKLRSFSSGRGGRQPRKVRRVKISYVIRRLCLCVILSVCNSEL
jgi:hypothetical protein